MKVPDRWFATTLAVFLMSACSSTGSSEGSAPAAKTSNALSTDLAELEAIAVQQEEPVWCWAACAEMILRFHGRETSQAEIAERIHGHADGGELEVQMASRYEVMCALNPDMEVAEFDLIWAGIRQQIESPSFTVEGLDDRRIGYGDEQCVNIAVDRFAPSKTLAIDELRAGIPAVVGLRESKDAAEGHAYVLCGASYLPQGAVKGFFREAGAKLPGIFGSRYPATVEWEEWQADLVTSRFDSGAYEVQEVRLVDPWDGALAAMPFGEFKTRVDFVITKSDARQILEAWMNLVQLEQR